MNNHRVLLAVVILGPSTGLRAAEPPPKSRFVHNLEAGRKQTLVAYGTSLTAIGAWVDQLRAVLDQQFPGLATVVNGAQGGANSVWGREKLDDRVLAHKPDTVLIEFSVNDAVQSLKITPAQARENLENMIDRILQANPGCEVILQVMNPPVGHTKTSRPHLEAYDQIYRDVAKKRGLRLIDHGPAWVGLMKKDPVRFMRCSPDTIHPVRNGSLEVSTPVVLAGLGLAPGNPAASTDDPCWKYMRILMDADKDGAVTRAEFDALWAGYFTKGDTNGDGNLDAGEFHYEELTRGLDANHDGKLEVNEFVAPLEPLFNSDPKNPAKQQAGLIGLDAALTWKRRGASHARSRPDFSRWRRPALKPLASRAGDTEAWDPVTGCGR